MYHRRVRNGVRERERRGRKSDMRKERVTRDSRYIEIDRNPD